MSSAILVTFFSSEARIDSVMQGAKDTQTLSGFGNHFETEAIPGTLPKGQNSPQRPSYGLYAEQLSGTAFTAPRAENLRSWLYRIQPSVVHSTFKSVDTGRLRTRPFEEPANPNQMRWDPFEIPKGSTDFVAGLATYVGNGSVGSVRGCAIHMYGLNAAMRDRYFYNADGEFLIVPEQGALTFFTEMGILHVAPGEIVVIPRGIKFRVEPRAECARGYICENYGLPFRLPQLGPIGANGLANPRDFQSPVAAFEEKHGKFELIAKMGGGLWACELDHSPLDVVAWHGNYAPYKYDLRHFQAVFSVTFDHSDPSIFTVLTSPSELPGTANVDFVIFPPRWLTMERTFRPPYFHRNVMSEFMGLVRGVYDAKATGFLPGGASLHNCLSAHGPDLETTERAEIKDLKPEFIGDTLAFMLESSLPFQVTSFASKTPALQKDYLGCWRGLKPRFKNAP